MNNYRISDSKLLVDETNRPVGYWHPDGSQWFFATINDDETGLIKPDGQPFDLEISSVQVSGPIADIAVEQGTDGQRVFANGRLTAGDGGGGGFVYSFASTATVDNGTVFAGPGGVGRWLRDGHNGTGFAGQLELSWFGGVADGATDCTAAYQALLAAVPASGADIVLRRGDWYFAATLDLDGTGHTKNYIRLRLDPNARLTFGASANPCIYAKGTRGHKISGGTIVGNYDLAGAYDSLVVTQGITSGSTEGLSGSAYALAYAGTVQITGLGVGYILAGNRIEVNDGAGTYIGYIAQASVLITAGVATVTLDRPLAAAITSGQVIFVKQYNNRLYTTAAYSSGVSTITVYGADVSTNPTPALRVGDQFVFYNNYNQIDSLDYSQVYTVTNTVSFTGTYPAASAVGVTISPVLQTNIALGTMISSVQDVRNNRNTTVLLFNTDVSVVESVTVTKPRLHAIMFNACVQAPWEGVSPASLPNTNCTIRNCRVEDGVTGTAFGATHAEGTDISGNYAYGVATMNGIQHEKCSRGVITGNNIVGMKDGIQVTGESNQIDVTDNIVKNCQTLINIRNVTKRNLVRGNALTPGASTQFAIRVEAGDRLATAIEGTSNTLCLVEGNVISGPATVSSTYNGSSIIVQPNRTDPLVTSQLRAHFVQIKNNVIYSPGRHGIHIMAGVFCRVTGNTILLPGYNGIRVENGFAVDVTENTVVDAGITSANSGIYITGLDRGYIDKNRVMTLMSSSPMTYGLEGSTCTNMVLGTNLFDGSTGRILGTSSFDNTVIGPSALITSNTGQNTAIGFEAGRQTTGTQGTYLGAQAGKVITSGTANTAIGHASGAVLLTTASRNTLLGKNTDSNNVNNGVAIGYGAIVRRAGEIALGDDTGTNAVLVAAAATAGGGVAVPATVAEFLDIRVNGNIRKIALFAA